MSTPHHEDIPYPVFFPHAGKTVSGLPAAAFIALILLTGPLLPSAADRSLEILEHSFEVFRVDGYIAFSTDVLMRSPLRPEDAARHLIQANLSPSPHNPRLAEAQVLFDEGDLIRFYQKYVIRVIIFEDSTEMVLDYRHRETEDGYLMEWNLVDSPDGKTIDSFGSCSITAEFPTGTTGQEERGPSLLRYRITTIVNRTDGFSEAVVSAFGWGEARSGLVRLFDGVSEDVSALR